MLEVSILVFVFNEEEIPAISRVEEFAASGLNEPFTQSNVLGVIQNNRHGAVKGQHALKSRRPLHGGFRVKKPFDFRLACLQKQFRVALHLRQKRLGFQI